MTRFRAALLTLILTAAFPPALHFLIWTFYSSPAVRTDIFFIILSSALTLLLCRYSKAPQWVYILFHELSHALAAVLFSGKIEEISVNRDSGFVRTDRTNFWIRLAPYLLPLLPLTAVMLGYIVLLAYRFNNQSIPLFLEVLRPILLGISLTVFLKFNLKLVHNETSDISPDEAFFSILLILLAQMFWTSLLWLLTFQQEWILSKIWFVN